jgi:hypothetical protein
LEEEEEEDEFERECVEKGMDQKTPYPFVVQGYGPKRTF